MSAEIWALAGVVVGAAGGLGAAAISSRAARRAPLDTQRRDKRREVYAAFVRVASEMEIKADPHSAGGYRLDSAAPDAEEWVHELNRLRRELMATYPLIQLEGPREVERSGMEVMNAALMLVMAADTVTLADTPQLTKVAREIEKLSVAIRAFLVDCQAVLRI
ncbi:hypothetical protein ACFQ64_19840 [Streptomyces sp. NPDC056460]|uniref:hypothetical protein n=1 Tax=Streptomyces sp. NPDC056460 TaxID=3345825 RepID=UPI003695D181